MRTIIITGDRGSGKTTYARELVKEFPLAGGILARGYLDPATGRKDLYVVEDLRDGNKRILLEHCPSESHSDVGRFTIHEDSFSWAIEVLEDSKDRSPVLIDELGPLELTKKGYYDVATRLLSESRDLILVVRSQLLEAMLLLLGLKAEECDIHRVG